MTALAAGGSVLLLGVTAVVLWPRTYGTQATLALDGNPRVENPIALAGRIEATLLEREQLATVAMDLPPELRAPDPIGRLRAGIRVQVASTGGFQVEFRGSDPPSVQRIANHLAERAVTLMPKLTVSAEDVAPMKELAARSRAVSEFLTAHPEMTVEQVSDKPASPGGDGALDLLRAEKRQIEMRLLTDAVDNPYADPADDAAQLNRRLAEIKATISRREAALRQPRPASSTAPSPELTAEWRTLLGDLAKAQATANASPPRPSLTARITARAPLPSSPLTPNRSLLTAVAILLALAAAMVAYVLPRRASLGRQRSAPPEPLRSEPPPGPRRVDDIPARALLPGRSDPPPPGRSDPPPPGRSDPPPPGRSDPPPPGRSDPPPPGRSDPPPKRSDPPPGPMAPQRTVVVSSSPPPDVKAPEVKRSITHPGGLAAPAADAITAYEAKPQWSAAPRNVSTPPPAMLGSRPPPGAGGYSVSSSHPPPFDGGGGRTSIERLSPLSSAHPPPSASALPPVTTLGTGAEHPPSSVPAREPEPAAAPDAPAPQIMSRPPALDPDAERWAARFETINPPGEVEEPPREPARKRSGGRWTTQVMGSMVPLEAGSLRDERQPESLAAPSSVRPQLRHLREQPLDGPLAHIEQRDLPFGWTPRIDASGPVVAPLSEALLQHVNSEPLRVAVTGDDAAAKAQLASALALALAGVGAKVLLVEADFDHPQLHQALTLTVPGGCGFSQQLAVRRVDARERPWVVMRCSANLQVLAEGRLRSPGLTLSDDFARALHELSPSYQVVVIHAPGLSKHNELSILDTLVQAAVVARSGIAPTLRLGRNPLRAP